MTKLSIIIPVYNAEKEIEKSIESILNQTFKDYEIICINDGSVDNSWDILTKLSKKEKRIKIFDQKNQGPHVARNNGMTKAKGEYIMFMDSDDYLQSNSFLQEYMDKITSKKLDILIGSYVKRDENGKLLYKQKINTKSSWTKYMQVTPWGRIFRRDFLEKNKIDFEKVIIGEDIYFNFKAYMCTNKIGYIKNFDYVYFFNTQSYTNTGQRGLKEKIDILSLYDLLLKFVDLKDKQMKYFLYRYAVWYLLFSGRAATKDRFIEEYKRIYKYLKDNNIYKTISPLSFKLRGEGFRNRMAVLTFKILDKLHLYKLFASIYCKGEK